MLRAVIYIRHILVGIAVYAVDLIVEIKAVSDLNTAHETQLVNYLTTTNIDNGLLINFGSERLEVKRKYRVYKDTSIEKIKGYRKYK